MCGDKKNFHHVSADVKWVVEKMEHGQFLVTFLSIYCLPISELARKILWVEFKLSMRSVHKKSSVPLVEF